MVSLAGSDTGAGTAASPLRTIAAALARALPGDVVQVQSGTYAEGAAGQNFALRMAQDQVVLTAAPGAAVTVVPASTTIRFGIILFGSHLVVNGINLQGFRPAIHYGRDDVSQRNIVISNLSITATPGAGFTDGIASYADARTKGFPIVDGLLIKKVNVTGHGLSVSCNAGPCKSLRLEDVKVVGNGSGGGNSGADAIAIEQGDNLLFLRVDVSGSGADGIDTKATRVVIWDSRVHDLARNGIKLWWGGDVVNTVIYNTGADAALVVKQGDRLRLLHSSIGNLNSTGYSITVRWDDNGPILVEIIDSIISRTGGPAYISSAAKLSLQNSILFGSANGRLLTHGALEVTAATGAAMLGTGNLTVDPGLDGTMHPLAGSIVANHGKAVPPLYPIEDLDGKPRVKGAAPDIGAYETF